MHVGCFQGCCALLGHIACDSSYRKAKRQFIGQHACPQPHALPVAQAACSVRRADSCCGRCPTCIFIYLPQPRARSCVLCSNRPSMYNSCIGSFVAQTFLYKQHCWGNQPNRTTDTISSNHTTCLQQCYCTHVNIQLAGGSPTDNNRTEQQAADSERFIHYDWPSVGNCRRQLVVTAAQEAQSYFTTL